MNGNTRRKIRAFHLLAGATAAALAVGPARKSNIRYGLYSLAGLELWRGLTVSDDPVTTRLLPAREETVKRANVKGIKMRWEEYGDASPDSLAVILVHGLPTNPSVWRHVVPLIKRRGIRCLAWEQVGFGWSMQEGLERDISIPSQAQYLYDWLQHLSIKRAVFVGHDYGGGVIQQLLADHPELAAGLVLTDSVAYDNWPVAAVRLARSMAGLLEKLPPALVKPIFYAGISQLGHDNSAVKRESARLYWEPYQSSLGPLAFAHQLRHFDSRNTQRTSPQLKKLHIPARVIWGDKDMLSIASGERLARDLQAPFTTIPGGRHFTIEDHPMVIAKAVMEVVAEVIAENAVAEGRRPGLDGPEL